MERAQTEQALQAADAFGREPASPWRRRRGSQPAAPKAVAVVATFVATLLAGALSISGDIRFVIVPLIAAVPAVILERVYRARLRRRQEQLLPPADRR